MISDAVINLMDRYGSALTLTRTVGAAYDPATGKVSGGVVTTFTVRGVFINYLAEEIDGTVIRAGDRRLLVGPRGSTTVPAIGDTVDGHKLVDVRSYAPNGVEVGWACQARK